jgi:hypothetical protein
MNFSLNRYWYFLLLMLLGYGLFEYYRPKPLDWKESYSNRDHIPFGGKVIFKLLPELVGNQRVESVRIPPYNQLDSNHSAHKSSYVFINSRFKIDNNDKNRLFDYVRAGNVVFISAYRFDKNFLDSLEIDAPMNKPTVNDSASRVYFVNPLLKDHKGSLFDKDDGTNYLVNKSKKTITVLAVNEKKQPVFIKVNHGKGHFFIHNLPLAFTNYYVLDSLTDTHAFQALSYLPRQPVYWDEYQKQGRFGENQHSIFRYIVSNRALKAAFILTLIGLITYAVFGGKRTQRVIPIMNPPANVSLEFVKTIGNMYYRKKDHANLAAKLAQQFRMYLRERFGIQHQALSPAELEEVIARSSGLSRQETSDLLAELDDEGVWSGKRLVELNTKLEDFYERTR